MFTILIGSVAKKQQKLNSDIDIVRIGHENISERQREWPRGPISYIDYGYEEFNRLYEAGSLFIYHMVTEGILLQGNINSWHTLVEHFKFIDTYEEELNIIKELYDSVANSLIYGGIFLSFYSNIFTLLKNYAIFYLAHNGVFEFNKEYSFKKVFGQEYYNLLNTSYNIFERNDMTGYELYEFKSLELANSIIKYFKEKLEVIR